MNVKYRHAQDPNTEKIHDIKKSWLHSRCMYGLVTGEIPTYQQFEKQELARFEADKEKGIILEYEVV